MPNEIDVLAIDDDKFIQKVIRKALESSGLSVRTADDGESGIKEAIRKLPSIILLDVEMPGINGYEVCDRLRNTEATKEVPIVFLSSHSSLRERLQGYEVGADDYLVKPFEAEHLLARINVLIKYHHERQELRSEFELAQKTAMMALTGSSELGQAMQFLEKSLRYQSVDDLTIGFFESTNRFSLDCCLMIMSNEQYFWYSSDGAISPLEKELLEMSDRDIRFLDFGCRTIINYPIVSLLIKNMPLDDMERYGRIKDLLPVLLSAVNTKINALGTQEALTQQSLNLLNSFNVIRKNLYYLGSTIVKNRKDSTETMNSMVQNLNYDLLRMGLEEDQEEYLLNRIDSAIEEAMEQMDAGQEIREALTFILSNIKTVMVKQEELLDAYSASLTDESTDQTDDNDDSVELF
jgi:CheY-like chemotaxis protein